MRRCCPRASAASNSVCSMAWRLPEDRSSLVDVHAGEYNWAEQAPHGTVPVLETTEGFAIGDSAAIVDYILEKTPEGPLTPKDTKARCLAKDAWNFCNDYYAFFLSPYHDVIMNHAEPHCQRSQSTVEQVTSP